MKKTLPFISIIIPTYNSERSLPDCLRSLSIQAYPKKKIEILVVDGSSDDSTRQIAKSFDVRVLSVPKKKQNAEYNKSLGFRKSKGEFVLILDSDNILPNKDWLKHMIEPFLIHPNLVGTNTLYFTYNKSFSLLDRYLSLFGSLDPVAYYLHKVDKLPYGTKKYTLLGKSKKYKDYYLVVFHPDAVPSIGSNGFFIRKKILSNYGLVDAKHFFHTDVHVDVIKKGFNSYAFVNESIIHETGNRNIVNFFIRRYHFLTFNLINKKYRRHSVYQTQDTFFLILFIIYSITFIKPLYDSIQGYRRIKDIAWFLHPIFCFLFFLVYSFGYMSVFTRKVIGK